VIFGLSRVVFLPSPYKVMPAPLSNDPAAPGELAQPAPPPFEYVFFNYTN
jgi:hypothetical protein